MTEGLVILTCHVPQLSQVPAAILRCQVVPRRDIPAQGCLLIIKQKQKPQLHFSG